jgi:hypothetical protein
MGQAQYQRLLQEFEVALRAQDLPPLNPDELWPYLGNTSAHDIPDFKHSVSSIVRNLALEFFGSIPELISFFPYENRFLESVFDLQRYLKDWDTFIREPLPQQEKLQIMPSAEAEERQESRQIQNQRKIG